MSGPAHHLPFTAYTARVDAPYEWDENSLTNLRAAGVDWLDALYVLYESRPRVRTHIGAVLRVIAPARDGRLLAVVLIELDDDRYKVVSGRWLDDDEQQAMRKLLEGGR